MREHPITTWFVVLFAYITIVGAVALNAVGSEGRERDQKLNGNRVEQTRQSCRERNEERHVFRQNFQRQIDQTRLVPAAAFAQFGVTKRQAISGYQEAQAALHPLDCKARVRAVRAALD